MNQYFLVFSTAIFSLLVIGCSQSPPTNINNPATNETLHYSELGGFKHFISRKGIQLFDGDEPFRFIGLHATELHRIEDDVKSAGSTIGKSDHFKWPTAAEQENWIKSLVMTGHTASRTYTLSVEDISLPASTRQTMPAHIIWDDNSQEIVLNEEAMIVFDRLISLADRHGLRLIIPFIDHWSWWGGKAELALMMGEQGSDNTKTGPLYDINSKTFSAYQAIIEKVLTRKNTITGRQYSDEKAIMAWETGNELRGTNTQFLAKTAAFIKLLAPNQLVIDGDQQADNINSVGSVDVTNGEFLGLVDPNVDIQSNHYYGDYMTPENLIAQADVAQKYNKPFLLGEYGLQEFDKISAITKAAAKHPAVCGALIWGYRGHREAGGFYWHKEGNSGHMSYHLPGFKVNDNNNEINVVSLMRSTQAGITNNARALTYSQHWIMPDPPFLHPISNNKAINWMGSPMATSYNLYRSNNGEQWNLIAQNLVDAQNGFDPETMHLYTDKEILEKGQWHYKITAVNPAGESAPSNIQIVNK